MHLFYHNYIKFNMIKMSFRVMAAAARNCFVPKIHPMAIISQPIYPFCKTKPHESNEHHRHEELKNKHKHEKKQQEEEVEQEQEVEKEQHQNTECKEQHDHSKHNHKHHSETHKTPKNEHSHEQDHHHQKLSKMSFEELVEMKTEESMKYAHHIYEHEVRKLKEVREEIIHVKKNLEFYSKLEEEIQEKEIKLAENIKNCEEETALSKKRAEKEISESKTFAVTKIAKELLEVADCIASCRKYAQQSEIQDEYTKGVIKTQDMLKAILKKYEIEEFDPTNEEYNPNTQESLLVVPTPPGCKPNHVAMTMRTGYTISGRLLRSARVGIFN